MEIVIPTKKASLRQAKAVNEAQAKEAVRFLQSNGFTRDADLLKMHMQEADYKFDLEKIISVKKEVDGEILPADETEVSTAVYFLENISPDSAEFVRAMAEKKILSSLDLQKYVAMTKKEMIHEWIRIVNENSLGHVGLGDLNKQMKQYEGDLSRYAQSGGGKISITKLAGNYVDVGGKERPYDLVVLMAKEPVDPQKLLAAVETHVPSLEPTQVEAIETLSAADPDEIGS
jgi:hypothetical protein